MFGRLVDFAGLRFDKAPRQDLPNGSIEFQEGGEGREVTQYEFAAVGHDKINAYLEEKILEAIMSWIQFDESNRKGSFPAVN